jgi:hypothetical protein
VTSSGSKRLIEKRDIGRLHVLPSPCHVITVWIDGGWMVAAVLVKIMRHWLDSIDGQYKNKVYVVSVRITTTDYQTLRQVKKIYTN